MLLQVSRLQRTSCWTCSWELWHFWTSCTYALWYRFVGHASLFSRFGCVCYLTTRVVDTSNHVIIFCVLFHFCLFFWHDVPDCGYACISIWCLCTSLYLYGPLHMSFFILVLCLVVWCVWRGRFGWWVVFENWWKGCMIWSLFCYWGYELICIYLYCCWVLDWLPSQYGCDAGVR